MSVGDSAVGDVAVGDVEAPPISSLFPHARFWVALSTNAKPFAALTAGIVSSFSGIAATRSAQAESVSAKNSVLAISAPGARLSTLIETELRTSEQVTTDSRQSAHVITV